MDGFYPNCDGWNHCLDKDGKFSQKNYDWMEWGMNDGWMMDEPFGCKFHFLDEVFGWLMGQL